jgi:16S rRNA (cytosine967-C5)-methyltransferase
MRGESRNASPLWQGTFSLSPQVEQARNIPGCQNMAWRGCFALMTMVLGNAAARVIRRAQEGRADLALRDEIKALRLSQEDSATLVNLVFGYYRWRGWHDPDQDIAAELEQSAALEKRLADDPESFSTTELLRAVPGWAREEISWSRELLLSLQTRPAVWLRARHLTREKVAHKLGDCRFGPAPATDSIEYIGRKDLFRTPEFHDGEFELQDIASQLVGVCCNPQPGQIWWDACAGEGGKLLHLSGLMHGKGLIWASDRSRRRLDALRRRAARAGVFNYRLAAWDGDGKLPTKTKFDGVLIDAPCSGAGTWQRNPDARWTTTLSDVQELGEVQRRLILNAAAGVKPGGRLIYAVCTLTRTETEVVADLCSRQLSGFESLSLPDWPNEPPAASSRKWIWPQAFRGNGMFLAAWQRVS